MQIIINIALITINETLFIQLISFLIFLFVINRLMFRPLQDTMSERNIYITNLKREIIDADKELDTITSQLKEKESATRDEANEVRKELEESGNQEAKEIFAQIKDEIAVLRQKTEEDVNAQIAEARKHIGTESEKLATSIMEKVLDRGVA
jgi:F-type H+-transporting ATPase subunit b